MLDREADASSPFARMRNVEKRRAAFAERNHALAFGDEWQKFAKSPDSALILGPAARLAISPRVAERLRRDSRRIVSDVEQASTGFAEIAHPVERVLAPATLFDAL